jgi:hypothetical protein
MYTTADERVLDKSDNRTRNKGAVNDQEGLDEDKSPTYVYENANI